MVNDLDLEAAQSCAAALRGGGTEALAVGGSITDTDAPESLIKACVDEFGVPDILVNNAGFLYDGMMHKMGDEQWSSVLDCHLTAPFRLVRAAAPHVRGAARAELEAGGRPRDRAIVNVSSTSGLHGNLGQANYAAAKAGVCGLTKTIAKEWGPLGVRCNAIAFGFIDTRMTRSLEGGETVSVGGEAVPQGLPDHVARAVSSAQTLAANVPLARKGTDEEAASGILFLASPLASYVTGHTLEVTGGMGI